VTTAGTVRSYICVRPRKSPGAARTEGPVDVCVVERDQPLQLLHCEWSILYRSVLRG
jgi:hypothetical protein